MNYQEILFITFQIKSFKNIIKHLTNLIFTIKMIILIFVTSITNLPALIN